MNLFNDNEPSMSSVDFKLSDAWIGRNGAIDAFTGDISSRCHMSVGTGIATVGRFFRVTDYVELSCQ